MDIEDYDTVSLYTWTADVREYGAVYARSVVGGKTLRLHNLIMNGKGIDHKDGNPLNNRRANLRFATPSQNNHNRQKRRNNPGFKGTHFECGKWVAKYIYAVKSKALMEPRSR